MRKQVPEVLDNLTTAAFKCRPNAKACAVFSMLCYLQLKEDGSTATKGTMLTYHLDVYRE